MEKIVRNECCFTEIFMFAEDEFGIGWNPCNDLFFNGPIEYRNVTNLDIDEMVEYLSGDIVNDNYDLPKPFSEYTKDEILEMDDKDKAYFIIAKFMISHDVTSITVDAN